MVLADGALVLPRGRLKENKKLESCKSLVIPRAWTISGESIFIMATIESPLSLFAVVRSGRVQQVEEMLTSNPKLINSRDSDGLSPLIHAARYGYLSMSKLLLSKGADPMQGDRNNSLPIHHAAQCGYQDLVQLLLSLDTIDSASRKAYVLSVNIWNRTPFWHAAVHASSEENITMLFKEAPEALFILSKRIKLISTNRFDAEITDKPCRSILWDIVQAGTGTHDIVHTLASSVFGPDWMLKDPATREDIPEIMTRLCSMRQCQLFLDLLKLNPNYVHLTNKRGQTIHDLILSSESLKAYAVIEERFSVEERIDLLNRETENGRTPIYYPISLYRIKMSNHLINFLEATFRDSNFQHLRSKIRSCLRPISISPDVSANSTASGNILHLPPPKYSMLKRILQLMGALDPNQLWMNLNQFDSHRYSNGDLPLHAALRFSKVKNVELLIRLGSPLGSTRSGMSLYHRASTDKAILLLRGLGIEFPSNFDLEEFAFRKEMEVMMTEKEILAIRQRVYFDSSLMERLLYFTEG